MKYSALLFLLFVSLMVEAIPARKLYRDYTLADGSTVRATLVGDEHGSWLQTDDGRLLVVGSDGSYMYGTMDELQAVRDDRNGRVAMENERRAQRLPRRESSLKSLGKDANVSYIGEKRGLVILVEFSDVKMSEAARSGGIDDMFNRKGYDEEGHVGSVSDYFYDQSYGKFSLTFDVVGPYAVSKAMSYYGENSYGGNGDLKRRDIHVGEMICEAVKKANKDVDFSKYDWDGDGYVDQVYVIYAGRGESSTGTDSDIWPHEWSLNSTWYYYRDGDGVLTCDGVYVDTYAISNELETIEMEDNSTKTILTPVGVACHEFSHCLGLPDFYDTSDEQKAVGMGFWDLLDLGCYNGPNGCGAVPSGYTAYERWIAGWLELEELSENKAVTGMGCIADEAEAYIIYNDKNRNEAYILENRQPYKWFSYLWYYSASEKDASGLLVYHVDYSSDAWDENSINSDIDHQRMTFVKSDPDGGDYAHYLFPGLSEVTTFGGGADESAFFYDSTASTGKRLMECGISNIVESSEGYISFNFFDTSSTPVESVKADMKDDTGVYDLAGRKVSDSVEGLGRGMYIVGGRKIVVK